MNEFGRGARIGRRVVGTMACGWVVSICVASLAEEVEETPFPQATPESQGVSAAALERLRGTVQGLVDRDEIVGAELLVVKNRRTVLHAAFGSKDREAKQAMAPNTIFCVRSMTKAVAGLAIQMLADDGKLSIDDPVAKHLPVFDTDACRPITIRHLLMHTSGLQLSSLLAHGLKEVHDLSDIARWTVEHGPDFTPGERWQYSDDGADTLGAIVAKASGMPTDEFVRRRIFEPLGMRDSICVVRKDDPRTARIGSSYAGGKGAWTRFWAPGGDPLFPIFLCSQGLYSTTVDYARFLAFFLDGGKVGDKRLLSESAVRRVLEPGPDSSLPGGFDGLATRYGQMMMLYVAASGKVGAFGHGGSDGTHAYAFPDRDLLVLYFTQSRGNLSFVEFERSLQRSLIDPEGAAKAEALERSVAADLQRYVGLYWLDQEKSPRYCTVQAQDGKLSVEFPWESVYTLKFDGETDRFSFELATQAKVSFSRDESGAVSMLELAISGRRTQWKRFEPEAGLPSVDELMALREKAHHGSRLEGLPCVRLTGSAKRLKPSEVTGEISLLLEGARRRRTEFSMGQMSETMAIDGERVFRRAAMEAASELTGVQAEQALLDSITVSIGDWRRHFRDVRILRKVDLDGRPAIVVRCVPREAPAHTYYVDAESGLLLGKDVVELLPGMGGVGSSTRFEDMRDVEGLTLPFKMTTRYASPLIGVFVVQLEKVEKVPSTPENAFRLEMAK